MNGILNINKVMDWTSHDIVAKVRNILRIKKIGHTGTLDPIATGVLLLCIGKATKIIRFLPDDKVYKTKICLGTETETYDRAGEIVAEKPLNSISEERIREILPEFMGTIKQIPPIYSAIKVKGKALYSLARKGESVDVPSRTVHISSITLESVDLPMITLRVACSAGTYIRSLAHDLGQKLGCGAHVSELERTHIAQFSLDDAISLANLTPEIARSELISIDVALSHLPEMVVKSDFVAKLKNGIVPQRDDIQLYPETSSKTLLRLKSPEGNLVAIATFCPEPFLIRFERVL